MTIRVVQPSAAGLAAVGAINEELRRQGDNSNLPVAERRAALEAFAAAQPPVDGVTITPGTLGRCPVLEVAPPDARGHALFLHGGAYVLGSAETHKGLAARYALASGLVMHVLDYRLAPEHPYPAALDDALAAAEALAAIDPDYALIGDSAGGGLALALLIALRSRSRCLPRMAALSSPWLDLALTGASMDGMAGQDAMLSRHGLAQDSDRYRGALPADDRSVSPLFADLSGLPPLFVHVGGAEVLRDDSVRLHDRVVAAGGEIVLELWAGMTHAWHAFGAMLPEAGAAITSMGEALRPGRPAD